MNPILLYTNNEAIATEIAFYNNVAPYFQAMYDATQAIGLTPTLQDLNIFSQWARRPDCQRSLENYVKSGLLAKAGNVNFNGVAVDQNKLLDLIVIPDLTAFKAAVNSSIWAFSQRNNGVNNAYLQLVDNVVSVANTAAAAIAAKYTYYTTTDAGTTKANELQAICDTLNTYDAANGKPFYNGISANTFYGQNLPIPLPGIDVRDGVFVVSVSYIATYEANN